MCIRDSSYLRVVQVEDVALEGLRGHDYRDAAMGDRIVRETGTELIVEGEVDRVYHDVRRPQLLKAGNHSLGIQSQGFPDVVVWNPWVDKCAALADMPANGWRHMLCVEAVSYTHLDVYKRQYPGCARQICRGRPAHRCNRRSGRRK